MLYVFRKGLWVFNQSHAWGPCTLNRGTVGCSGVVVGKTKGEKGYHPISLRPLPPEPHLILEPTFNVTLTAMATPHPPTHQTHWPQPTRPDDVLLQKRGDRGEVYCNRTRGEPAHPGVPCFRPHGFWHPGSSNWRGRCRANAPDGAAVSSGSTQCDATHNRRPDTLSRVHMVHRTAGRRPDGPSTARIRSIQINSARQPRVPPCPTGTHHQDISIALMGVVDWRCMHHAEQKMHVAMASEHSFDPQAPGQTGGRARARRMRHSWM